MEHTVLFYGTYFNKTYSLPLVEGRLTYNMGLSYLLATGAAFLVSFFLLVKKCVQSILHGNIFLFRQLILDVYLICKIVCMKIILYVCQSMFRFPIWKFEMSKHCNEKITM